MMQAVLEQVGMSSSLGAYPREVLIRMHYINFTGTTQTKHAAH